MGSAITAIRLLTGFVAVRWRLFVGVLCSLIAYGLIPPTLALQTRLVVAWDAGAVLYLLFSAILFVREPQSKMAGNARAQQEGEWTIFSLTVAVIIISFVAILGVFASSKSEPRNLRDLHVALVAFTLAVSWLTTHTIFAFRYAHEYYSLRRGAREIERGLEFPGESAPDYLDFAYFSLVIGMTFQVSDVRIIARKLRRLALVHALLSFVFNTVILALTVNLAAGLL